MAAGDTSLSYRRVQLLGDQAGNIRHIGVTTGGDLYTFAHRTLTNQRDATLNDSDKIFTVPAARLWWLHQIYAELVTSGTANDRILRLEITHDGTNPSLRHQVPITQAANLTRNYTWASSYPENTAFNGGNAILPLPTRLLIPAGGTVRISDVASVDPTADDLTIVLIHDEIAV